MKSTSMGHKRDHPEDHSSSRGLPAPRRGTRPARRPGRSWVRARTRQQRGLEVVGGSPTSSQVASRPGHRTACVTGEGAGGRRLLRVRHTGHSGWRHRNRSPGQWWTDNGCPRSVGTTSLVACCMSTNQLHATRLCTLRQSLAASAHPRASTGRILVGAALSRCRVARGRVTARPHAGLALPGRRAAAFAGLRCVQDQSGLLAAPPVAK
jgi:hypothetical protein